MSSLAYKLYSCFVILLFLFQTKPSNLLTKKIASLGYFGTYFQVKRRLFVFSLGTILFHFFWPYPHIIPSVSVSLKRMLLLGTMCFFLASVYLIRKTEDDFTPEDFTSEEAAAMSGVDTTKQQQEHAEEDEEQKPVA